MTFPQWFVRATRGQGSRTLAHDMSWENTPWHAVQALIRCT